MTTLHPGDKGLVVDAKSSSMSREMYEPRHCLRNFSFYSTPKAFCAVQTPTLYATIRDPAVNPMNG